jgi:DNA-binding NtrC family response regulator
VQQRVLLLGLEQATTTALDAALHLGEFEVRSLASCEIEGLRAAIAEFSPHVICVPAGSIEWRHPLQAAGPTIPVIAVSSKPNPKEWLAALQSGASDYFGPPFEVGQVSLVLQSARRGWGMTSMLSLTA